MDEKGSGGRNDLGEDHVTESPQKATEAQQVSSETGAQVETQKRMEQDLEQITARTQD